MQKGWAHNFRTCLDAERNKVKKTKKQKKQQVRLFKQTRKFMEDLNLIIFCLRDQHVNVYIGRLIEDMKYCRFVCCRERKFQASHKEDDWEF